jgi:hypothetical protein
MSRSPRWWRTIRERGRAALGVLLLFLGGCTAGPTCLLPEQRPLVVIHMFFGRDIPGRSALSDAEWAAFAADVVTAHFADGFTSFDGDGQWRDPEKGAIVRERTKIVLVAAAATSDLATRVRAVRDAYRRRFDQAAVGVTAEPGCGAF